MRYGTRTECKRRWTRQSRRPVCRLKIGYSWGYLYVLINPFRGEIFAWYFTHLDKDCFEGFIKEFLNYLQQKQTIPNQPIEPVLIIGDRATAHTSYKMPEPLQFQPLPTACPELNPVERFFQELRRRLANTVFETKQEVENVLSELIGQWKEEPEKLSKLTLFSFYK